MGVTEITDARKGGLAIGISHTAPEELSDVPTKAEDIPLTFAIGYGGSVYLNGCERRVNWNPEHLQVSQRVGLLVTDDGRGDLIVFEDLTPVVRISGFALRDAGLLAGPLYPLIDFCGATSAVTLVPRPVLPKQRWDHLDSVELELAESLLESTSSMLQSTKAAAMQRPVPDLLQSTRQVAKAA